VENTPGEVTQLLIELKRGDRTAEDRLIPLVYAELRRIAAAKLRGERQGHSLQPTALVHEAYLRLTGIKEIDWDSRAQFFKVAAIVMRNILVDHARKKLAAKHGGAGVQVDDDFVDRLPAPERPTDILALDEALNRLAAVDPDLAELVLLRFFSGMTEEEIAAARATSVRTVKRHWHKARNWLYTELSPGMEIQPPPPIPSQGDLRRRHNQHPQCNPSIDSK
jgi:RNA polymerase sigma factor (TIGR02999 family)